MTNASTMQRRLGLGDATFIGLGSMIGAGIFAAFSPAARAAGNGLLVGVVVAAVVAFCNATSSAQLAAQYPTSGGTYVYGRERLGAWWGFVAGWSFVIGKIASCAAMAMTFAAYVAPPGWERPIGVAAVLVLAAVNYRGITRTATLTRVIVVAVLVVLAVVVAAGLTSGLPHSASLADSSLVSHGAYGILQSAGLMFFAFAGYARIATMGEEVREPARTIPRAILLALGITVIVYFVLAVVALGTLGPDAVAGSSAPLAATVSSAGWQWAEPVVRVGAALASLGALLALIAGIGRTTLAMAREGDLPRWLAAIHPRFGTPYRAEVVLALVVVVITALADLRGAIGFSSFGVLLYYFVANVAAFTQDAGHRRYARALQALGALGCLVLAFTLPPVAVIVGAGVVALGIAYRGIRLAVTVK
ncbi:MAG: amino acid permease [Actinomycetota bacterium]